MENEQQHPGVNILARAKYELELEKVNASYHGRVWQRFCDMNLMSILVQHCPSLHDTILSTRAPAMDR